MKTLCVVAALSAVCLLPQLAAANLLANPSFDGSFVDDGNGVGKWNPFSNGGPNTSEITTNMPRTGASSAELNLVDANSFAGFFQDVSAGAGSAIDFSVWAADASGLAGAGVEMRIEYRDSVANAEVARTANLVPTLSADYELVTLSDTVPAGADTARVVFAIQSFGAGVPQTVFVDDASVVLPEPSSLALIGLAGVLAAAARRR